MANSAEQKSSMPDRPSPSDPRLDRRGSRRRLIVWTILAGGFAALCALGVTDQSIRTDPFGADPGWLEWFRKPQPDPRLALIPVLPMGGAGVLSWRPKSPAWLAGRPA